MSTAQKVGVGLFYAAMAVLGAAYAVFEHHQADRLVLFLKEMMPTLLVLILVLFVYGLFRTAVSVFKELSGASPAAHATRHMNYGKK